MTNSHYFLHVFTIFEELWRIVDEQLSFELRNALKQMRKTNIFSWAKNMSPNLIDELHLWGIPLLQLWFWYFSFIFYENHKAQFFKNAWLWSKNKALFCYILNEFWQIRIISSFFLWAILLSLLFINLKVVRRLLKLENSRQQYFKSKLHLLSLAKSLHKNVVNLYSTL